MISEKTMSQFSCFQLWPCCFTSTEARLLIRDGGGGGGGGGGGERKSEGLTTYTAWKRLERPWTTTRTMEVLRQCPLTIAADIQLSAGQSHKDNVRCTAVEEQTEVKEVLLSQPSSTSLFMISSGPTWGSSSTSLLWISLFPVIIRIIYLCTVSLQRYGETKGGGGGEGGGTM